MNCFFTANLVFAILACAGSLRAQDKSPFPDPLPPVSGSYYDWAKTRKPERPYIHAYDQTLVMKIFLAEKRANDGCHVYLTFEQALDVVIRLDNLTCGIPKIVYLVGWQYNGHDSKYPSWAEVNPRLKRAADATATDSLKWLMAEGSKHHTIISLHVNMFDAYEDSPLWDEYVQKDVIAKDKDGHLIKGEVQGGDASRPETQSYQISYAREWETGLSRRRIDGLLAMLPIEKAGTIHIDAFHSLRPIPHTYPQERYPNLPKSDQRISPFLDYSLAKEVEAQRKILRYFRDKGIDVTSEGSTFLRPDAFVGLQPMAWHYEAPAGGIPPSLYCGSVMGAEQEIKRDPGHLSGLLDQFCMNVVPQVWSNHWRHDDDANQPQAADWNRVKQGGDVCIPLTWKADNTLLAYSRDGYSSKVWKLPAGSAKYNRVLVSRIGMNEPEKVCEVPVINETIELKLGRGEGLLITPLP